MSDWLVCPGCGRSLDVERLARAILRIRVRDNRDGEFSASAMDLDWGWEWYASPREMATDIIAALAEATDVA